MVKKMKIAMTLLSGIRYGGITYYMNFIPALAKVDDVNEYHIFIQKDHPLSRIVKQNNFIFHECGSGLQSAFMRLLWEQFKLPQELRKRRIDVIFTAKNANILLAPCKTVISIRNMEPLCYYRYKNHWKLDFLSWLRCQLTKVSIKKADRIVAVSRFVQKHLQEHFSGLAHKIDLVYNGNTLWDCNKKFPEIKQNGHFLLSASKFVAYANQFNLLQGYAQLCQKDENVPPLWIAGGILDRSYFKEIIKIIHEKNISAKVKILGLIPHEHLMQLYGRALAFLFPSTLEACPQTLIEAMSCGVPIATSNISPMPEICHDAAIYFDPFDKEDIARKINMLLTDCNLREHLRERSLVRCQFFDWEKAAIEMIKVFQKVYKSNS